MAYCDWSDENCEEGCCPICGEMCNHGPSDFGVDLGDNIGYGLTYTCSKCKRSFYGVYHNEWVFYGINEEEK